jgi:hypothetical protein
MTCAMEFVDVSRSLAVLGWKEDFNLIFGVVILNAACNVEFFVR